MAATGLSADPTEYRARLGEQDDAQLDAWASELMRDVAKRRGVLKVLADFGQATLPSGRVLVLEVRRTPEERARGYMGRAHVGDDEGMLFVHPEPAVRKFWMKNCLVSLDLIWMDADHRIVHIEHGGARTYSGNYSAFEDQRAEQLAQQQSMYERQQREIKHMMSFVERFRAKASKARQAQSRLKALERMEHMQQDAERWVAHAQPDADLLELRNVTLLGALVIRCALFREESRGLHARAQFPELDDTRCLGDTQLSTDGAARLAPLPKGGGHAIGERI